MCRLWCFSLETSCSWTFSLQVSQNIYIKTRAPSSDVVSNSLHVKATECLLHQVKGLRKSLQKDSGASQLFTMEEECCLWAASKEQRLQQALEKAFEGLSGFKATALGKYGCSENHILCPMIY